MKSSKIVNEADFQAAIIERLRAAFPVLPTNIRAERYLKLKLGHHDVSIDGSHNSKDFVKGRSDVVVFYEDQPLLLAELKAPGVTITDEDVDQGLSYARTHQPMVPLVLVTNGDRKSTRLVMTYDGASITGEVTGAESLMQVVSAASTLARDSTEGAVRILLGRDTRLWLSLLNKWNTQEISSRTGELPDLHRAIAHEFIIRRDVVDDIYRALEERAAVSILHGPPLSGVTVTLIQLIEQLSGKPVLYVDRRNSGDILQYLSSRLTQELSFGISRDDVRQWLIIGQPLSDLVLVIDGLPNSELEELLQLAELKRLQLVIGIDSSTNDSNRNLAWRTEETLLGRLGRFFELPELSDKEFLHASKLFLELKHSLFMKGAELIPELRRPRQLRLIASLLPQEPPQIRLGDDGSEWESHFIISAIPSYGMLERASNLIGADPRLKHDLSKLAAAYLSDLVESVKDSNFVSETYGAPSIDPDLLELQLGGQRVERLVKAGFVRWVDSKGLGPRLAIRFPEQLAHYISKRWEEELNSAAGDDELENLLGHIIRLSDYLPDGDRCVAAAISNVRSGERVLDIINLLISASPQPTFLTEGSVIEILAKDEQKIRLHFGEGMKERLAGDLQPWLILSYLAMTPVGGGAGGGLLNWGIFAELGNCEDLIFKPPVREIKNMVSLHTHDIPGVGSVLCIDSGIVEPIMQAMYQCISTRPDELDPFVEYAIQEDKRHLAWRLLVVCKTMIDSYDENVSAAVIKAISKLEAYWETFLVTAVED